MQLEIKMRLNLYNKVNGNNGIGPATSRVRRPGLPSSRSSRPGLRTIAARRCRLSFVPSPLHLQPKRRPPPPSGVDAEA